MKLNELAGVLSDEARRTAEVRMETNARDSGYDILCQGAGSSVYGDKEVEEVYPINFDGEFSPSLVIWVKG